MLNKILQYLLLFVSLSVLVSTTALQYTHDSQHEHCESSCGDPQNSSEECALCWFVAHQLIAVVNFDNPSFEPITHTIITTYKQRPKAFAIDLLILQKGNKDPPACI